MANYHEIKCDPVHFQALITGEKNFEIRKNDRGYRVGDDLLIREFDRRNGEYTGRMLGKKITYIVEGQYGLPLDICVMQLR